MNQKWGFQLLSVFLVLFLISGIVAALMQQGGQSGKSGAAPGSQAELVALRVRIDNLEKRLAQQATQASEEKLLMIRVLDASTRRLDELCRAIEAGAPIKKAGGAVAKTVDGAAEGLAVTKDPAAGDKAGSGPLADTTSAAVSDGFSFVQMAVIFGAMSVLLLVAIVVFFPGRLRGTVPQIEYAAEPAAVELPRVEQAGDEEASPGTPERAAAAKTGTGSTGPAIVPVARHFPDPILVDGDPVAHKLSIGLDDQKSLESLVTVLDSYLNTEPYILRNPAPRVSVGKGEVHLKFYALPSLSKTEHELLDANVRRLHPASSPAQGARQTWGKGSKPESSQDSQDFSIA